MIRPKLSKKVEVEEEVAATRLELHTLEEQHSSFVSFKQFKIAPTNKGKKNIES
jgi:hypothetical protein